MRYEATGLMEYPQLSWPLFWLTCLWLTLLGILALLYRSKAISVLTTAILGGLIVLFMMGDLSFSKRLYRKLRKSIVIDDNGIRITDITTKNLIMLDKIIEKNFSWNEVRSVKLLSRWRGPIEINTAHGSVSLWFGGRSDINQQIVKEIQARLSGDPA